MNRIKPGEVIKILPVKGITYKIGPGENLSIIADKFEISIKRVIDSNQIADPERVYAGKMLIFIWSKAGIWLSGSLGKTIHKTNKCPHIILFWPKMG